MNIRKEMKRNRGVALASVIITIAVVTILGTAILYMSYTGLTMRLVKRSAGKNFYNAESVMDEIAAGLEKDMAEQYIKAYTEVMKNYGSYSSAADMQTAFQSEFILNMVDVLHQTVSVDPGTGAALGNAPSDALYSVQHLNSYVNHGHYSGATILVTYENDSSVRAGSNGLQTLTDGLLLRNVKVVYTKDSYTNTICSDLKILTPNVEFYVVSSMPDISGYSYIADSGVVVNGGVTMKLNGNGYSGNTSSMDESGNVSGSTRSVMLNTNSILNAVNSNLLVVNGDLVAEGAATLQTGSAETASSQVTSLWAQNLVAQKSSSGTANASNNLSLLGRTYVADDVTLNGASNTLTLGGQFYGYSSGTEKAADSSAIIINGGDTTLDMSGLDTLVVAGTAFVQTSTVGSGNANLKNEKDVITGDSVALKSNQYAYMVPTECAGITTNPMSYTQYAELTKNGDADGDGTEDWIEAALNTNLPSLNRTLSSYGHVEIVPIFSASDGGTVYLYLKFADVTEASGYFMDVYKSGGRVGNKVKSYMDNYLAGVRFNLLGGSGASGMTRLVTSGNYLTNGTYDSASGKWKPAYSNVSGSAGDVAQELGNYASSYEALCTKLVTSSSSLTTVEKTRTVFENLVDEEKLYNPSPEQDSLFEYEYSDIAAFGMDASTGARMVTFAGSSVEAIIVNNAGKGAYTVGTSGGSGLLLATGDVVLNGNWNGIIICKGTLTISGNATLTSDAALTDAALRLECKLQDASGNALTDTEGNQKTFAVLNLFRGGEEYSSGSQQDDNAVNMNDVRNCIAYENWTSQ